MLISVLERRSEIGLRRALGATKGHIRTQFLSEAILLALLGGAVGVTLGIVATAIYAHTKNWTTVIPTLAWAGGLAAAIASAPSPAYCPRSVPPGSHPPTHCELSDRRDHPLHSLCSAAPEQPQGQPRDSDCRSHHFVALWRAAAGESQA